jgi:hypothetical protein
MKTKLFFALLICLISVLNLLAQTPQIRKVIFEPNYPHYNHIRIEGDNIENVDPYSFGGDWISNWDQCHPCATNSLFNLSVNRGENNPIYIKYGRLIVGGVEYYPTIGSIEMTFNAPPFQLYRFYGRRDEIHLTRQGTANIRVIARRDYPYPPDPYLDQTLQMNCTAYAKLSKYRNYNNTSFLHDTNTLRWECTKTE